MGIATAAILVLLLPTTGRAQTNQTYTGGTGVWDAGTTADWSGATWTAGNNAIFNKAPANTVTVSGTVNVNELEFINSGATTISGGTIDETAHSTTAGDPTLISDTGSSGPVTISSQIELADLGGDEQNFITNSSSNNLTLGSIDFGAYTINPAAIGNRRVQLNSSSALGIITLAGTYTDSVANHYGTFNVNTNTGGIYIAASANFSGYLNGVLSNYAGGSEYISNSTFLSTFEFTEANANGGANAINLVGAQTIQASLYDSMKGSGTKIVDGNNTPPTSVSINGYAHINQSTAAQSTWAGYINLDGSNINLSAVTGGRLNVTGNLGSAALTSNGSSPEGMIVSGGGTVVLGNPNGSNYNEEDGLGYIQTLNPVAADLQSGTTLITNTKGSAFGAVTSSGKNPNGSVPLLTTNPAIVKLEAGATLGGTGISTEQIVAEGATSVITAGDPGQAGLGIAPSFGVLHLTGGLAAANGLTLDFKLDGTYDNDAISLGSGTLTLNGTVTVNFSSVDGSVVTGNIYTLMTGTGSWTGSAPSFDFTTPAGYVLDKSYNGTGYDFNNGNGDPDTADTFTVEFALAPEPSTYGMLGLGLLALIGICRWTHRSTTHRFDEARSASVK
jgi:hypothetical protein